MDMMRRCGIFAIALALVAAMAGATLLAGQSQAAASKTKPSASTWTGRTAWGDPDLQGKWLVAETVAPLERPKELGNREFFTDQEYADRLAQFKSQGPPDDRDADDVRAKQPRHERGARGEKS